MMAMEQLSLQTSTAVNQRIDAIIAESLHLIALWLSSDSVWRLPEAVIAAMNSTEISRQLAKQDPTVYRLQLGKALNIASIALSKRDGSASLYGTSAGLKLSMEAAQIFQDLERNRFVTLFQKDDSVGDDAGATIMIQSHLADSLLIQSYHIQSLETKAAVLGEAIKINHWLSFKEPDNISYKAGLAVCLEHYAELLILQEHSNRAKEILKEVVETQHWCFVNDRAFKAFSDAPPANLTKYMNDPQNTTSSILENAVYTLCKHAARQGTKLDEMAQSILLCNISRRLQRQKLYSAAQRAIEEAIAITSEVCNRSPEVLYINEHQELLAYFLYKLFIFICYKREYTGARAVLEESIKIRNQLCSVQKSFAFEAEGDPFMQSPPKSSEHEKILADSLYILWCFSAKHDNYNTARDALMHSIAVVHEVVVRNPAEDKTPLAALLHELSIEFFTEGNHNQAIECINEAISIYRSSKMRDVSCLVVPLQHLFLYLSEEPNYQAANEALMESLEIDGGAFDDPSNLSIHEASMAQSLTILAKTLEEQGCYDDAINAMEEVVQIHRLLSSNQPHDLSHKISLAASLYNLAVRRAQHAKSAKIAEVEGLAEPDIKEVIELVRQVTIERMPDARYRPGLEMPGDLSRDEPEEITNKEVHRVRFL
jgi:tetratricopeptide (TPR) repeat protein